jgi:acetyltransferase-like isoleucine patch superfamily enzyme
MRFYKKIIYTIYQKIKNQVAFYEYNNNIQSGLLEVGKHTYGATKIKIDHYQGSESKVTIGSYCSIAKNVRIITGGIHPPEWIALFPFRIVWGLEGAIKDGTPATKGPVTIGHDVWIGTNVTILSGVTVGHGSIILSGSVVTKDIPSYAIAGGVPAKVVKYRFSEDEIKILLKIKWWEWNEEKIKKFIPMLSSNYIKEFILKNTTES